MASIVRAFPNVYSGRVNRQFLGGNDRSERSDRLESGISPKLAPLKVPMRKSQAATVSRATQRAISRGAQPKRKNVEKKVGSKRWSNRSELLLVTCALYKSMVINATHQKSENRSNDLSFCFPGVLYSPTGLMERKIAPRYRWLYFICFPVSFSLAESLNNQYMYSVKTSSDDNSRFGFRRNSKCRQIPVEFKLCQGFEYSNISSVSRTSIYLFISIIIINNGI